MTGQPSLRHIGIVCCDQKMIPLYENEEEDEYRTELIIGSNCSVCGGNYLSSIARKLDTDAGADSVFRFEAALESEKYIQVQERRSIRIERELGEVRAYLQAIWKEVGGLKRRHLQPKKKAKKRRPSR